MTRLHYAMVCLFVGAVCSIIVLAALVHGKARRDRVHQPAPDTRECC